MRRAGGRLKIFVLQAVEKAGCRKVKLGQNGVYYGHSSVCLTQLYCSASLTAFSTLCKYLTVLAIEPRSDALKQDRKVLSQRHMV